MVSWRPGRGKLRSRLDPNSSRPAGTSVQRGIPVRYAPVNTSNGLSVVFFKHPIRGLIEGEDTPDEIGLPPGSRFHEDPLEVAPCRARPDPCGDGGLLDRHAADEARRERGLGR